MAFDRTNPAQLAELTAEVTLDPTGLGYVPSGATAPILALINTANPATLQPKPNISAAILRSGVTYEAYNTLSIDEQEWLRWITGSGGVSEEDMSVTADLRLQLTGDGNPTNSMWAAAHRDAMVPVMFAILNEPASRAEILWGRLTTISQYDWQAATEAA